MDVRSSIASLVYFVDNPTSFRRRRLVQLTLLLHSALATCLNLVSSHFWQKVTPFATQIEERERRDESVRC